MSDSGEILERDRFLGLGQGFAVDLDRGDQARAEDLIKLYEGQYPQLPSMRPLLCMRRPFGALRCKSLFCPRCHDERQKELRHRLEAVLDAGIQRNIDIRFLTFTLPHPSAISLAQQNDLITAGYQSARESSRYRRLVAAGRLFGLVNIPDLTWGTNGWHLHVHTLLFAETRIFAQESARIIEDKFKFGLQKLGLAPGRICFDDRPIWDAEGLAGYLARSWHRSPAAGLTPLGLLDEAMRGSDGAASRYFEAYAARRSKQRGVVHGPLARRLKNAGIFGGGSL